MSSDEIAIRVTNLSKCYQIYATPRDRLKQFIVPRVRSLARIKPRQYFREFWALRDVSFEVKKGETVGIVGRNGSGKSTLLHLICGTLSPTAGSVETSGRVAALLELGAGFNPEFTGRENVYLNAALLGLSNEETAQRFDAIAAFADIGDFIDQPAKTYSSGMVVRLAFGIQAMVEPDVLVVDEALAVGDEKFQRKCFARLEDLKNRGTVILFVSHSAPQVVELCDRTLLLEDGERIMYAHPPDVVRSYQRLIYASNAERPQILQDLREANRAESGAARESPAAPFADTFDAGLVPATTTSYLVRGAEIEFMQVEDVQGRIVNLLRQAGRYRIVMSGRAHEDLRGISFGVHIRSISGAVITGQRYPADGEFMELRAGAKFRLSCWFTMRLLPDTYFAGGGIWSGVGDDCVHRKLDATMFRVQSDGPQSAFGYCNLVAAPAAIELD